LFSGGVFWLLHQRQAHPGYLVIQMVSFGIVGLVLLALSKFALAIPAVVFDDYGVGQAMFRSDKLTQGKWLILASLLAKSLIGGYIAAMFPFWLRAWIWAYVPIPGWVATVASIAGVIVVEPTMFIGFALLYLMNVAGVPWLERSNDPSVRLAQERAV
jgi:hypothetical protein